MPSAPSSPARSWSSTTAPPTIPPKSSRTEATSRSSRSPTTAATAARSCCGFAWAAESGVERLITMDCDGQHEPRHIPQFLEALGAPEPPDIVSGSRYLPQSGSAGVGPSAAQRGEPPGDRRDQPGHRMGPDRRVLRIQGLPRELTAAAAACTSRATRCRSSFGPRRGRRGSLWSRFPSSGSTAITSVRSASTSTTPKRGYAYYMTVWHSALEEA